VRITTGGSLLRTDAGALALGRRGACGLPLPELPLPSWGGDQDERAGRRSPECCQTPIQGTGEGPKAEGSEPRAGGALGRTRSQGDRCSGRAASRDRDNDSFAFGASLLGFVELGLYVVYDTPSVPK